MPHTPQLLRSVSVSRQVPEQLVSPVLHDTVHMPREQTCPEGHARAQAPQLLLSVWRSRHTPEHSLVPTVHETWQVPAEHT